MGRSLFTCFLPSSGGQKSEVVVCGPSRGKPPVAARVPRLAAASPQPLHPPSRGLPSLRVSVRLTNLPGTDQGPL